MDFPQGHCKCHEWLKRGGDDCSYQFCLNECSTHGKCVKGQCQCESNYYGEDCSVFVVTVLKQAKNLSFAALVTMTLLISSWLF